MASFNKVKTNRLFVRGEAIFNGGVAGGTGGFVRPTGVSNTGNSAVVYHVDRNVAASGDGTSWDKAFKTFSEAIDAVNADYTEGTANFRSKGRNRTILVGEGWYDEEPMTLTANDVYILGVASGSHDHTVIYDSNDSAAAPLLQLTCSNCTFENLGFYSADDSVPCISDGGAAGDSWLSAVANSYSNMFINCQWVRNAADTYTYGLRIASNEGPYVIGCTFSCSAKTAAIAIDSNGVTNPVGVRIEDCVIMGVPTGIIQTAGHNTIIRNNVFLDTTDDRADTVDAPCNIAATSALMYHNIAMGTTIAEFNAGAAGTEIANLCSDSNDDTYPAASA